MPGRSLLTKASGASIGDDGYVKDYLDRVIAADVAAGNTQGLEQDVADAIKICLQALVADGLLGVSGGVISQAASKVKAMCFLCGARTLSGCLVPVVGPAPTNIGFGANDYNRKTGLGDPSNTNKYLDSNRSNSADPQNSKHLSVYVSTAATSTAFAGDIGINVSGGSGGSYVGRASGQYNVGVNCDSIIGGASNVLGFRGASRSLSSSFSYRASGSTISLTASSLTPLSENIRVFSGGPGLGSNARLSVYSIGESIDLAVLDARITTLMNTLAAVIP